jgi:hypothetical protein
MPPQPAPLVVEYPRAPISTTAVAQPATATKTEASTDEEPPKHLR